MFYKTNTKTLFLKITYINKFLFFVFKKCFLKQLVKHLHFYKIIENHFLFFNLKQF